MQIKSQIEVIGGSQELIVSLEYKVQEQSRVSVQLINDYFMQVSMTNTITDHPVDNQGVIKQQLLAKCHKKYNLLSIEVTLSDRKSLVIPLPVQIHQHVQTVNGRGVIGLKREYRTFKDNRRTTKAMDMQFSISEIKRFFKGELTRVGGKCGVEKYMIELEFQGICYVLKIVTYESVFVLLMVRRDECPQDYFQVALLDTLLTGYQFLLAKSL